MHIYYVYAYLNRQTGKPYYIGKGQGDRINSPHLNLNLPPDPKNRIIIENNLSEQDAWNLEVELIKHYGRKDLGTGSLLNKTEGGIGGDTSLYRNYTPMSEETKQKLSYTKKQQNKKPPWNKGLKGISHLNPGNCKPRSEETKEKIRKARSQQIITEETREKLSKARKGKPRPEAREWMLGRKTSEETKQKIGNANRGKIVSEEQKQKIREARAKQTITEETKQTLKGKVVVIDKEGKMFKIDKDVYYSQPSIGDQRDYVFHNCTEGKRRKHLTKQ